MSEPTHIVIFWKSNEAEHLYRASDGIQIGQRKDHVVLFGENPNKKESRVFIDAASASKYLRGVVPQEDQARIRLTDIQANGIANVTTPKTFTLELRDAEHLVIAPSGAIELPGSGTRKLN